MDPVVVLGTQELYRKLAHWNLLHLMDPVVVLGAQKLYRKLAHLMAQILNIVRNLNKDRV